MLIMAFFASRCRENADITGTRENGRIRLARKDYPMFTRDLLAGKRILVTGGGTECLARACPDASWNWGRR